ncbi:MAG: hypothetical protein WDO72_09170 [Pseudomonadota bacterium]
MNFSAAARHSQSLKVARLARVMNVQAAMPPQKSNDCHKWSTNASISG